MSDSSTKKYCKLVMVTEANNNKFYEMSCDDGKSIVISYGRVELTSKTYTKPISEWESIYKSKTKKGYKDVTHLVSTQVVDTSASSATPAQIKKIDDLRVDTFINLMKRYTDKLVSTTYSVKCDNVSPQQIAEAQALIDELTKINKKDTSKINQKLIDLYTVIPRYMSNVKSYILPVIDLEQAFVQEQDNLDAMASQVAMYAADPAAKQKKDDKKSLLDIMGITMKETKSNKELDYLIKQVTRNKVESIFEVNKAAEDAVFSNWLNKQKNKDTRILIHGTRCTSVIPILEQGLKIRPSGNFQFSGKVYGDGNYFSEVVNKSLNYTGYDNDKILLVYEVHTGNPFIYDGWYKGNDFSLNYNELSKRGFDSTYVKAGNGLLNSEIIAYKEQQNRIKYIIWLKN